MRLYRLAPWLCGVLAAATTSITAPRIAASEEAIALDRFHPAPAGDRMFGVPSPYAAGSPGIHVMLLGDYAHNPLVVRRDSDDMNFGAIVSSQFFLHLNANLALWDRLSINVDVPMALVQAGEMPHPDSATTFQSPTSAQFGDIRIGLRLPLVGDYFDPVQLAVSGSMWLPTGNADADSFVSDGAVRGLVQFVLGGRTDRLVWSGALGAELRPSKSFAGIPQGTAVSGGVGIGVLLGADKQLQIGPELSGSSVIEARSASYPDAELLLDARYRFLRNFEAAVGAGPGLTRGVGTPDLRVVASIAYTPEKKRPVPPTDRDKDGFFDDNDACPDVVGVKDADPKKNGCPPPPPDRDKDGFVDDNDACPDVAGIADIDPKKNGCPPPPDRDKDGIIDDADACPDLAGVADPDPKKNGCPSDKDEDGIYDKDDACVVIKGIKTEDPKTNGCPPDTDGDTIRDDTDACPSDKGPASPNPKRNGCPVVRVGAQEVFILEQVEFDTGKATIRKVSDPLLDKVATVLKDHPELTKVEVQGHTDNKGGEKANEILSQNRANSVMAALVKRKIDKKRLTAKGYGQTVPIDTNDTEEGRQNNRRVQFKILEKVQPK